MHTSGSLASFHTHNHSILAKLIEHCRGFSPEQLDCEHQGFGYPCIRVQLQHVIGAEQYWVGVINGKMLVDEDEADAASVDALEAFRARVADATADYLNSTDDGALNTPRTMTTWGGHERELVPANIVLRTQTHIYHHLGQVTAMCRLLDRPVAPGLDYPVIA